VDELPGLKQSLAELQVAESSGAEQNSRASWWQNQLTGLIGSIESLSVEGAGLMTFEGVSEEHSWSVPLRLESAERLREGFSPGGEFLLRWEEAASAIKATYPGLDLPVQMGLVPIGADPASELLEFWHVASGTEPLRGEDGVLMLEESSGLVLVLLPGGKFWMGASKDPDAPHNYDKDAASDEGPVHEVELSAFFLSKYEMTQGQWKQLSGTNPSLYGPDGTYGTNWNEKGLEATLLEPVEQVSWDTSKALLDRVGLELPSEAQWEYGCRGGTSSIYWSGDAKEDLQGVANLADKYASENGGGAWTGIEEWLEDGYMVHAAVNTLQANGFGLHHVHGNVWEWCLDGYDSDFYGRSSAVDPVSPASASADRVSRGGSFLNAASGARSADRNGYSPRSESNDLGLRPSQGITSFSFTTSPVSDD
jgi:formylglycine-generating enzyme required for sulfatase activity